VAARERRRPDRHILMSDPIEFRVVTPHDLLRATLFSKCRLVATGCWEWHGWRRNGYGLLWHNGKNQSAHRVSYETFNRPIPDGMKVLHSCDNPRCINPNHLSVGTQKQNVAEREMRDRRDVRGEQIGTSKLTSEEVVEIKASALSLGKLAKQYGVAKQTIWKIRIGGAWKHLNAMPGIEVRDGR